MTSRKTHLKIICFHFYCRFPVDRTFIQRGKTPRSFAFNFKPRRNAYGKNKRPYVHCKCRICPLNSKKCYFANKISRRLDAGAEDVESQYDQGEDYELVYVETPM